MPDDADFERVVADTFGPNACTPPLRDHSDFRGIAVAAPTTVWFDDDTADPLFGGFCKLVLCGAYQLDGNYMGLRERFLPRLLVVAFEARTHRAFAARVDPGDPNPAAVPSPFDLDPIDDSDFAGRVVTEYFNPNLARVLALPEREGDYYAYATLGHYVSNVVRIALRRRGAAP